MKFKSFTILLFFITTFSYSQEVKEKPIRLKGLIFGFNGFNNNTIEIGYGSVLFKNYQKKNANKERNVLVFLDGSFEFSFRNNFYCAPKISNKYFFEKTGIKGTPMGLIFGADYIAYNDLKVINNLIRPSIGFQLFEGAFEFSYGYNLRLDNNRELFLNKNNFQFILRPYIFKDLVNGMF